MLIRYSILAAASGSIGGVTASHGRSGQYVRARTVPVNPSSPFQNQVRIIFGNLSIAWQTLTDAQRDSWATYAANVPVRNRIGDTIFLTGHTMYIRSNVVRIQAGLSRVDDGPTVFASLQLSTIQILPREGLQDFFTSFSVPDPWMTTPGAALVLYATRQTAGTVRFRKTSYRPSAFPLLAVLPPPPFNVSFVPPFRLDANGSNSIFARYVALLPDGRVSASTNTGPLLIVS